MIIHCSFIISILFVLLLCGNVAASEPTITISYNEFISRLAQHDEIQTVEIQKNIQEQEGIIKSSWGDPQFKITGKNYPAKTLHFNDTPMTGIEYSLSQKVPLTNKYGKMKEESDYKVQALDMKSRQNKNELIKKFWEILIDLKLAKENLNIFDESQNWLKKILTVSKKFYTTGKLGQQTLLEIESRIQELEEKVTSENSKIKRLNIELNYLNPQNADNGMVNNGEVIYNITAIPWDKISKDYAKNQNIDYQEKYFQKNLEAKKMNYQVQKREFIPDLQLSVGYTQRPKIDKNGDFVGAMVGINIPISDARFGQYHKSASELLLANKELQLYHQKRLTAIASKKIFIEEVKENLDRLSNKTIAFAEQSKTLYTKLYGLGRGSYVDLLTSEVRLLGLKLKRNEIKALLSKTYLELAYLSGDDLNEI